MATMMVLIRVMLSTVVDGDSNRTKLDGGDPDDDRISNGDAAEH